MRQAVLTGRLEGDKIWPADLLRQYEMLLQQDIQELLPASSRVDVACPVCPSEPTTFEYDKLGFSYRACEGCGSCFVSPRPDPLNLARFYKRSEAIRFFHGTLVHEAAETREDEVLRPRLEWIQRMTDGCLRPPLRWIDVETKYPSLFARVTRWGAVSRAYSVFPLLGGDSVRLGGAPCEIVEAGGPGGPPTSAADVVTAFEVIERAFDPNKILNQIHDWLRPGGLLFLTGTSGSGFEVRLLRQLSRHVLPPTHLNLLSLAAFERILDRAGFEVLELSTPGRLDVDMVAQAREDEPTLALPPILEDLVAASNPAVRMGLQELLQEARLSSHIRIVARRE